MRSVILILIIFTIPAFAHSAIIEVPKDYTTIQAAIDAATKGDTVLVAPGTYIENINFKGKAITVKSSAGATVTVVDGGKPVHPDYGSVVTFSNGDAEGLGSVLDGFTLTNGTGSVDSGSQPKGGGIYCANSTSPTITNNTIIKNYASKGGGIYFYFSSPTILNNTITSNYAFNGGGIYCVGGNFPIITNNTISGNRAADDGGGIYCYRSSPTIMNNTISGNMARYGGGIWCRSDSSPTITNTTISGNRAEQNGGGIWCYEDSSPTITNSIITGNRAESEGGGGIFSTWSYFTTVTNTILWDNRADSGPEILVGVKAPPLTATFTISYCDVKGGKASVEVAPQCTLNWGAGMIDQDPLFTTGPKGFYYLSQIAAGQSKDSPCVDTGSDLASALGMDIYWTRTDGIHDTGTVDMGYHYGPFVYPALQADTFDFYVSKGGVANFLLLGENANASRDYILLGSINPTITWPGPPVWINLPGGKVALPLTWDLFTDMVLTNINTPFFSNFMGKLDTAGTGAAALNTLGPVNPVAVGLRIYFAYALNRPWDFVSNSVSIEIVL